MCASASTPSAGFVGNSVHVSTKNVVDTSILKRSLSIKMPRPDAYGIRASIDLSGQLCGIPCRTTGLPQFGPPSSWRRGIKADLPACPPGWRLPHFQVWKRCLAEWSPLPRRRRFVSRCASRQHSRQTRWHSLSFRRGPVRPPDDEFDCFSAPVSCFDPTCRPAPEPRRCTRCLLLTAPSVCIGRGAAQRGRLGQVRHRSASGCSAVPRGPSASGPASDLPEAAAHCGSVPK